MTTLVPTALSMKLKFPEFSSLADGTIEFAIEEAGNSVTDDSGWTSDRDQTLAYMYLAAHFLMVSLSRSQSGTGQRISSESMDGMSFSYMKEDNPPDLGDYTTTPYGSRYLDLVSLNFPAIAVI